MPVPRPLAETFLKIERAKQHVEELDRRIGEFEAAKHYRVIGEFNEQRTTYLVRTESGATDWTWGGLIFDAANNMRATLDNMVYAVTKPVVRRPSAKLAFAIHDHASALHGPAYRAATNDIPEPYKSIVHNLQPCNGSMGNSTRAQSLTFLRILSNREKHRHGQTTELVLNGGGMSITCGRDVVLTSPVLRDLTRKKRPVDGANIAEVDVRVTGKAPQMHVYDQLMTQVAFGDRIQGLRGEAVRHVLAAMLTTTLFAYKLFMDVEP